MSRIISLVSSLLLVSLAFSIVGLLSNQWFQLSTNNNTNSTHKHYNRKAHLGLWFECRTVDLNESSNKLSSSLSVIQQFDWFRNSSQEYQSSGCWRLEVSQYPGFDSNEINLIRGLYITGLVCLLASLLISILVRFMSDSSGCCCCCCCCSNPKSKDEFSITSSFAVSLPSIKPVHSLDNQFYQRLPRPSRYKHSCIKRYRRFKHFIFILFHLFKYILID